MSQHQCPKCGNTIDEDFGMVQCSGCQSYFYIDLSGKLVDQSESSTTSSDDSSDELVTDAEVQEAGASDEENIFSEESFVEPQESSQDFWQEEPSPMGEDFVSEEVEEVHQVETDDSFFQWEEDQDDSELDYDASGSTEEDSFSSNDSFTDNSFESAEESGLGFSEEPVSADSSDLSDITDFGNSDTIQNKTGAYLYKLVISGVDDGELRTQIKDILSEKLLMIDLDEVLSSSDKDKIEISKLNPVKVNYIVRNLRELPVDVLWEQYGLVEA